MTTLAQKIGSVADQYSPGFLELMQFTLPHEVVFAQGHYNDYDFVVTENVKGDPGGPTKYGIDSANHHDVVVQNLTFETALAVYFRTIWTPLRGELVHGNVAIALCDASVNCGNLRAIEWMQAAAQVKVDGVFGPKTLLAVNQVDPVVITNGINNARDHYYRFEVRQDLRDHFLTGWENRLHDLIAFESTLPDVTSQAA